MKIAITGGTGFLGQYLVEQLLNKQYKPLILTRHNNNGSNKIIHLQTDYSVASLKESLKDVDAVVHLAAKRSSSSNLQDFVREQIMTQNLYEACRENSINNIIYASSISVYSDQEKLPWIESEIANPVSIYGVNKLTNEKLSEFYNNKYDMNIKVLRFAHLFGFNEKNNYMINRFMRQAINKDKIILHDMNKDKREFLYVKEAARAIVSAIETSNVKGVFNVGSNEAYTNFEVAQKVNKVFENDDNYKIEVTQNKQIKNNSSYMQVNKFLNNFNYEQKYSFETALQEIYIQMKVLENVPLWY